MEKPNGGPMAAHQILDMYFLDNRARMLEIASFLDRIDRCPDSPAAQDDFRYQAFMRCLKSLLESAEGRTARVQMLLSDPTPQPIICVSDPKAYGAWKGKSHDDY
jgi:hypothetical protein